jgi:hypothetical protein
MRNQYKRVVCADGLEMSVQANHGAYCSPRDDVGPYEAVEVGFPSYPVMELMDYAEDPTEPEDTVYGWVPLELVRKIIYVRGGMVSGELPPHVETDIEV